MRLAEVPALIDINGIEDLSHISVESSGVTFGAIARHSDLLAHTRVCAEQPLISVALEYVAHATIRNRGTTVGAIVHADASGEMPVVLALTGGSLTVASMRGRRHIDADDLFIGPLETSLKDDEIAVEAFVPPLPARSGVAFDEVARRHGDYALCGAAAIVSHDNRGMIEHARIGYVAMADVPVVVDVTSCVSGGQLTDDSVVASADMALERLDPVTDIHGSADYRRHLAHTLTGKTLKKADADARSRSDQ